MYDNFFTQFSLNCSNLDYGQFVRFGIYFKRYAMRKEEKLYEVFGELLYALAKADGVIKKEEKETLTQLLKNHALGSEILWSFEFEESHNSSVEEIYNKVINFCHVWPGSTIR